MTRLPTPGGDTGNWGTILNEYLLTAHSDDGSLKSGIVAGGNIADGAVTTDALADASVTMDKLASSLQTTLSSVVASSMIGKAGGIASLDSSGKVPASQLPVMNSDGTVIPDASASTKGIIQLAGDLSGSASSPKVVGINGVAVSGTPSAGQALVATGAASAGWSTVSGGGGTPLAGTGHVWNTTTDPSTGATADEVGSGDIWNDSTSDSANILTKAWINGQWVILATTPKPTGGGDPDPDPTTPDAPTNAAQSDLTDTSVVLSWTAPSAVVDGYNIYNGTTKLNTALVTDTTYTVTGLDAGTDYTFTIRSVSGTTESSTGAAIAVKTTGETDPDPDPTPTAHIFTNGKTVKIMPVGDSQVDGDGSTTGTGFRQLLWGKLSSYATESVGDRDDITNGYTVIDSQHTRHSGHSGWTLFQISENVGSWMTTYTPDVVLVMGGGNDLDTETVEVATTRMQILLQNIFAIDQNVYVFVSTTTPGNPVDAKRQSFNNNIQPLVNTFKSAGRNIYFVDNGGSMTSNDYFDTVHANDAGYEKMASNWYNALIEADTSTAPDPDPNPDPDTSTTLRDPVKKEIAMQLVSSSENSSLDWKAQYQYIEDIGDGRGYTAGIIGFCSGTGDMLELIEYYSEISPGNTLEAYLPALRSVNGTDSHDGLEGYPETWKTAVANDPKFRQAQDHERDRVYFEPSVTQAISDGLSILGQFIYYDCIVMHGYGWGGGMDTIRETAIGSKQTPAQGGNEKDYLTAFLDARRVEMKKEAAHEDTSRIDTCQLLFLNDENYNLNTPLTWSMYGEQFSISTDPTPTV